MILRVAAVCLCLVAAACVREGGPDHYASANLPWGSLDAPKNGAKIDGPFEISGWALSDTGIDRVEIYIDRKFVTDATMGLSRPDVGKAFSGVPGSAASGFKFNFLPGQLSTGQREITVQAHSRTGAVRELGTVTVTIASSRGNLDRPAKGAELPPRV